MGNGLKDRLSNIILPTSNEMRVWADGVISSNPTQINSLNFVMHYGAPAVWEGIRSYVQRDGSTKVWQLTPHIKRLYESAKIVDITIPYTAKELEEAIKAVVESCGGGDLYIRPIAYTTQEAEGVRSDEHKVNVDIYAFPFKRTKNKEYSVRISSRARGYPEYQMQAKTTSNYHFLHTCKNEFEGVDDLLFCDKDGYVVEASVANLYYLKGKYLVTPPQTGSILSGVTRKWVSENLPPGIQVVERRVTRPDLYTADEVFLCGTYMEITPVTKIDGRLINKGNPGRITKAIITAFNIATRGA